MVGDHKRGTANRGRALTESFPFLDEDEKKQPIVATATGRAKERQGERERETGREGGRKRERGHYPCGVSDRHCSGLSSSSEDEWSPCQVTPESGANQALIGNHGCPPPSICITVANDNPAPIKVRSHKYNYLSPVCVVTQVLSHDKP